VEVPISEVNALCFAQDRSWVVIPGNVNGYPLEVKGTIAENEFDIDKERPSLWPDLTYAYDPDLDSNPPPDWIETLPSSVNLVSLRRK